MILPADSSTVHSTESETLRTISTRVEDGITHISIPPTLNRPGTLQSVQVQRTAWRDERTVPARLELDPARHYAVTAPADVIVEDFIVPLGAWVKRGEPLLEMSSVQIATLRGGLIRQQLLTEKAARSVQWHKEIQTKIDSIIDTVQANMEPIPERWIELDNELTADFGAKIVGAYAKYWSATKFSEIAQRASNSGVVAERMIVERMAEVESAKASLQGAIEQVRFEIQQAILTAESDLAAADGALQSNQSDMRRFLGMTEWNSQLVQESNETSSPDRFVHRSPGDGTVLERYFANGERASLGELIVLVADTSRLWLIGELRQQDWDLLHLDSGGKLEAEIVGLERLGRLPGVVEMLGGIVSTNSGSIRLTASLDNTKHLLRPGMIARIIVSTPREGIRLPATAVFTNDGVDYVLREDSEFNYSLLPITIGTRNQTDVEILEGINDGDSILISGVFPIASQAFLQEEE